MGSALFDDGAHVVGDEDLEDAPKEAPGRFEAVDDRLGGLAETEPYIAVTGVAGGENERPAHFLAARDGVGHQPHLAEVDLELRARLAIGHPQRRAPSAAANPERFQCIALQCAFWDNHSLACQELGGLDCGQAIIDQPGLQLVVVGLESRPGLPVPIWAVGPGLLAYLGH
jgi:hypothetical protein